jgi:lipopolysaccharide transport system permease protein
MSHWRELWAARDLWRFLVLRDLKTRYAQSVLGVGWAVVQPLFTTGVFSVIFGQLAAVPSDGVPYPLFSFTAMVAWTFFQTLVSDVSNCLTNNMGVITKVYFPRLVLPLAAVTAKLMDLVIMLVMLALMFAVMGRAPALVSLVVVPAALFVTLLAATGVGLWLAALSVQYRDVRHAQGFALQLLMYASPVIYSASLVPAKWRTLYDLNPLTGVIQSMRASLLPPTGSVPWSSLGLDAIVAVILFATGIRAFHRAVRIFADVA